MPTKLKTGSQSTRPKTFIEVGQTYQLTHVRYGKATVRILNKPGPAPAFSCKIKIITGHLRYPTTGTDFGPDSIMNLYGPNCHFDPAP